MSTCDTIAGILCLSFVLACAWVGMELAVDEVKRGGDDK